MSSTPSLRVYQQGALRKQGGSLGGWKTWHLRWFVFHELGVSYYTNEAAYKDGKKELGFLQYDPAFSIVDEPASAGDGAGGPLMMRINSKGRSVLVQARTVGEKHDWLHCVGRIRNDQELLSAILTGPAASPMQEQTQSIQTAAGPTQLTAFQRLGSIFKFSPSQPLTPGVKVASVSLHEGFLQKLGDKVQHWRSRFFILHNHGLEYFVKPFDKKPKGVIPLVYESTVISLINIRFTFAITPEPGKRKYILTADSQEAMQGWIDAIQPLVKNKLITLKALVSQDSSSSAIPDGAQYCTAIYMGPTSKAATAWNASDSIARHDSMDLDFFSTSIPAALSTSAPRHPALHGGTPPFGALGSSDLWDGALGGDFLAGDGGANEELNLLLLAILSGKEEKSGEQADANTSSPTSSGSSSSSSTVSAPAIPTKPLVSPTITPAFLSQPNPTFEPPPLTFALSSSPAAPASLAASLTLPSGALVPPHAPRKPLPQIPPMQQTDTQTPTISVSPPSPVFSVLPMPASSSVRLCSFLAFSCSVYSEENVHFYLAVEQYRCLPDQSAEQRDAAHALYKEYIRPGSEHEIFLPPAIKGPLDLALGQPTAATPATSAFASSTGAAIPTIVASMFDRAQKQVFLIIRADILPKFLEQEAATAAANNNNNANAGDDKKAATPTSSGGGPSSPSSASGSSPSFARGVPSQTVSASLDDLVLELLSIDLKSGWVDQLFRRAFLLNYPCFMTASDLLDRLEQAYFNNKNTTAAASESDLFRYSLANKLNILALLSHWLKNYPRDFMTQAIQSKFLHVSQEFQSEADRRLAAHEGAKNAGAANTMGPASMQAAAQAQVSPGLRSYAGLSPASFRLAGPGLASPAASPSGRLADPRLLGRSHRLHQPSIIVNPLETFDSFINEQQTQQMHTAPLAGNSVASPALMISSVGNSSLSGPAAAATTINQFIQHNISNAAGSNALSPALSPPMTLSSPISPSSPASLAVPLSPSSPPLPSHLARLVPDGYRRLQSELRALRDLFDAQLSQLARSATSPAPAPAASMALPLPALAGAGAAAALVEGEAGPLEGAGEEEEDENEENEEEEDNNMQRTQKAADGSSKCSSLSPSSPASAAPSAGRLNLLDYPPQRIAEVLTALDHGAIEAIDLREFVNKAWTRSEVARTQSPNILAAVALYNQRSYWVADEILRPDDFNTRVKLMKYFIQLALVCLKLRNYFCVFAVVSGLSLSPIHRLAAHWAKAGAASRRHFESLRSGLTDAGRNYRHYRKLFKMGIGQAQVPHVAILMKDCFQLEEIKTVGADGRIQIHKFLKQYKELQDFQQAQTASYHWEWADGDAGDECDGDASDESASVVISEPKLVGFSGVTGSMINLIPIQKAATAAQSPPTSPVAAAPSSPVPVDPMSALKTSLMASHAVAVTEDALFERSFKVEPRKQQQ